MNLLLSLAALVPALLLLIRIYRLDRIEKEPRRLLGKLILLGALAALPAAAVQLLLSRALLLVLERQTLAYVLLENFLVVACSEELCKAAPVRLAAWKHPAFDYRFDAVVYCVCAALGFASVENLLYVLQADLKTALSRAVLSVPGHFFFAVSMGLLLSRAKQAEKRGKPGRRTLLCALGVAVPAALHGFWDFCLSVRRPWAVLTFYVFVLVFFTAAEWELRKASCTDARL